MAKIGIAISSGCNGSHVNIGKGNETTYEHFFDREVAQAQRSVALSSADFFISAETNDLMGAGPGTDSYRWDGCHFYPRGEDVIAGRYATSIFKNLDEFYTEIHSD